MKLTNTNIEAYRKHLIWAEKSMATQEKYLRDVQNFASFAANQEITKELVHAWKQKLIQEKYAVNSINSMLASINSFLNFMDLSSCKVKRIRTQQQTYCTVDQDLSRNEYFQLLSASQNDEQLNLLLQTLCSTGIRVSELQYFSVEAIERGEIIISCKNKTRTILIPRKLQTKLLDYALHHHISTGPIFITKSGKPLDRSNIWASMKQLSEIAQINPAKVFPHNLRKLFARSFYSSEKDIAKLADILGHSNINTTRIYIMSSSIEHLKKIEQLDLVI
jgi:site-specific recombinase XerD